MEGCGCSLASFLLVALLRHLWKFWDTYEVIYLCGGHTFSRSARVKHFECLIPSLFSSSSSSRDLLAGGRSSSHSSSWYAPLVSIVSGRKSCTPPWLPAFRMSTRDCSLEVDARLPVSELWEGLVGNMSWKDGMKTCQLPCAYNLVALTWDTAVLDTLAIVSPLLSAVVLWALTFTPCGEGSHMGAVMDLLYKPLVTLWPTGLLRCGGLIYCCWYGSPAIGPITNGCWTALLLLRLSGGPGLTIVLGPCVGGMGAKRGGPGCAMNGHGQNWGCPWTPLKAALGNVPHWPDSGGCVP